MEGVLATNDFDTGNIGLFIFHTHSDRMCPAYFGEGG
jgi:hypothetical protein